MYTAVNYSYVLISRIKTLRASQGQSLTDEHPADPRSIYTGRSHPIVQREYRHTLLKPLEPVVDPCRHIQPVHAYCCQLNPFHLQLSWSSWNLCVTFPLSVQHAFTFRTAQRSSKIPEFKFQVSSWQVARRINAEAESKRGQIIKNELLTSYTELEPPTSSMNSTGLSNNDPLQLTPDPGAQGRVIASTFSRTLCTTYVYTVRAR